MYYIRNIPTNEKKKKQEKNYLMNIMTKNIINSLNFPVGNMIMFKYIIL